MNGYELSRNWFDWCFDNPDRIKPIHSAIYFFAIEHCNRLGWKDKFGFPSQMVMEAIGVKNWRTYSKALNEVVEFGFIEMLEISKNQYSSNIIAIVKNTKAPTKALDKALSKHYTKQGQSTYQGTVSIDKQYNNITIEQTNYSEKDFIENWGKCRKNYLNKVIHFKKLENYESGQFKLAKSEYTREQINNAMLGLFKQEVINIDSMRLKPKHFLENVGKYLEAELSKTYTLYGSKPKQVQY